VKHDPVDDDSGDENDEEAANVFVHAEDVRSSAKRGWRSVRDFLGMDEDSDDSDSSSATSADDDDDAHAKPSHASTASFSPSSSDSDVPDYYGDAERAPRRRRRRPRDVPKPFTAVRDDDDDANDENNPFAKAWNWLNRRARE